MHIIQRLINVGELLLCGSVVVVWECCFCVAVLRCFLLLLFLPRLPITSLWGIEAYSTVASVHYNTFNLSFTPVIFSIIILYNTKYTCTYNAAHFLSLKALSAIGTLISSFTQYNTHGSVACTIYTKAK